ncbi:tetratricopeptide repeat protein [Thermococcus pacificus]|nr:hypothetical protein [Thermococcus pacificus]
MALIILGTYVSGLTLPEARQIADNAESGDVALQWVPGAWPGELVTRKDGTTLWMETNFWNIQSGSGENYMRFIKNTEEVAFYVNMSGVVTNWGGNAFATPNVIFAGRAPAQWWGNKPTVGGYSWFSLPLGGDQINTLGSVWAKVDFELAKSPETLSRTGIIMWFEQPNGAPLGEVYIAFSDDYGGIVNTQWPPTDIGTITQTVYINGQARKVVFKIQRTWNWDHFVLEFIPDQEIPEGTIFIDVKQFAEAAVQGIVDDPYSSWTADQITWTSIGFGTYTGSNTDKFELGWILHDARLVESPLTLKVAKEIASTAESGDIVLQWSPDNPWPGELVTGEDGTTLWMETNFWNIVSGDGESYMRFISAGDSVAFYVNLSNVQTRWGGIAWATPAVVFAGRVPPSVTDGNELPSAGGYDYFSLPMPAVNVSNYNKILTKIDFELVKGEGTLVRPGIIMWFERSSDNYQLAEVYVPFFDDYNGIVGAQYGPWEVGTIEATVTINGVEKNVTFTVQKAWNWNNFAFEFIPSEPIAKGSGDVTIDLRPIVDKVIEEIIADQYSDYSENDIVWSSLAFGTYSGSDGTGFNYGWILHEAKVLPPKSEGTVESRESEIFYKIYVMWNYYNYYRYNKIREAYNKLLTNLTYEIPENILNTTEELRNRAEEDYQRAFELSSQPFYGGVANPRSFAYLRRAYLSIKNAEEILDKVIKYSQLAEEYKALLDEAKARNLSDEVLAEAENAGEKAADEYQKALSLPPGDPEIIDHVNEAYRFLEYATGILRDYITSLPVLEIKDLASEQDVGDVQFTWWDQWLEKPIKRSDGTTVWMQTNFWNIVDGQGEVYMRFIDASDSFAFYVDLENVKTQWGGIAWATPEVIIAGRAPAVWWGDKPPVGGYGFFDLPMPSSEISNYDHIWVKADYKVVKKEGLVRFGLLLWFENAEGWPVAEVYVPFFDDFGGLVGVSDKTTLGGINTTVNLNGETLEVTLKGEKGWNPGEWWSFEFIPQEQLPASGEIIIDIKPVVDEVIRQLSNQEITWTSISISSYSGSEGTAFNYGWILEDARVLPPEEAPTLD